MTSPSYPAALDALANPGPTTETDDAGFELDIVVARLQNCIMAIEGKLGIGTGGPPASNAVLRRTATGSSAWGQLTAADIAPAAVPTLLATSGVLAAPLVPITFSGISQAYSSLEVRIYGRSTAAVTIEGITLRFNGDSATNYFNQAIVGSGASASANEALSATFADLGVLPGASSSSSGWFVGATAIIHGYARTTFKVLHTTTAVTQTTLANASLAILKVSTWTSVAPVTSITVAPFSGAWAIGSQLSLYGHP